MKGLIQVANITGNLMGNTLRRSVEEVIWSWIRSKLKGNVWIGSKLKERALNLDILGII